MYRILLFLLLCFNGICKSHSAKVASLAQLQKIDQWVDNVIQKYEARVDFLALKEYYNTLRGWSNSHRRTIHAPPAMYFFSGADLYSLMGLFPHAPGYGMIAEFAPGGIDCFTNATCSEIATKRVVAWYEHVATCLFGFSITTYMREFFEKQTGILPAFLLVLRILNENVVHIETSETGLKIITQSTIINYQNIFIKDEQAFHDCMNMEGMPPKPWGFLFKSGGTLHGLVNKPWFLKSLFSSSSIIMHDETGPSLSAYNSSGFPWPTTPHGHFHLFTGNRDIYHSDLVEYEQLYKENRQDDIPFCFGYCLEFHTNGMLILAEREDLHNSKFKVATD